MPLGINQHFALAKADIAAGENKMRSAAEHIAAAIKLGASQRAAAYNVGKSPAWVNRLLKLRKAGYKDSAFGPENRAKRERDRVQSAKRKAEAAADTRTEQQKRADAVAEEVAAQQQQQEARARADEAKAEADKAKAKARQAKADVQAEKALSTRRARTSQGGERAHPATIL